MTAITVKKTYFSRLNILKKKGFSVVFGFSLQLLFFCHMMTPTSLELNFNDPVSSKNQQFLVSTTQSWEEGGLLREKFPKEFQILGEGAVGIL